MCLLKLFNNSNIQSKVLEVKSLAEYIKEVSGYNGDVLLFRGQSNKDFRLIPSVGRNEKFLQYEEQMFLEFKRSYYLYADNRPMTDMDTLFLAQHYGLPTRLLDWSYNPLVALYFACCNDFKIDGRVFIYKVPRQNNHVKEGHDLDNDIFSKTFEKEYLFIIPDYTDKRYVNQKGMFLWFKNPQKAFSDCFMTIIVKNKKAILSNLCSIGVTESFIYPTLDHICSEIKSKIQK